MSDQFNNRYYARITQEELVLAQMWLDLNASSYETKQVSDYWSKSACGYMVVLNDRKVMVNFRRMLRNLRSGV